MRSKSTIAGILLALPVFFCWAKKEENERERHRFVVLINLYNETHPNRIREYKLCLERNLSHPSIKKIHVVYDPSKDSEKNILLDYLKEKPVVITYKRGRATYGSFFELANTYYPDSHVIISNADIYFDDTLKLLEPYDLSRKFLALTRIDRMRNGFLKHTMLFNKKKKRMVKNELSQDVWIFKTPIMRFANDTIELGVHACDSAIAYYADKAGLAVYNPCLTINCFHLHTSRVRHHKKLKNPKKMAVPWIKLEDIA